jgi:hypothetical protein
MSIVRIQRAMEQNRDAFDQRVFEIRRDLGSTSSQRRRMLAEIWFDAMRTHYRLLGEYLELRDRAGDDVNPHPPRLMTMHLRAPQRPDELPESLSRYVTAAHHSEHLI